MTQTIEQFDSGFTKDGFELDGILLDVYLKQAHEVPLENNEGFIKHLLACSKNDYNYIIENKAHASLLITNKEVDASEEDNLVDEQDHDIEYNHPSRFKQSNEVDMESGDIQQIIHDIQKSNSELEMFMKCALLNIRTNLYNPGGNKLIESSFYTKEWLKETISLEIEKGLLLMLNLDTSIQVRFNLIHILALVPSVVELSPLIEHLKSLNSVDDSDPLEVELILSVILNTLLVNKESVDKLSTDHIDIIAEVGTKCEETLRVLELILNYAQRQGIFGVKINELRNSNVNINWEIVDDNRDSQVEVAPSFGFNRHQR